MTDQSPPSSSDDLAVRVSDLTVEFGPSHAPTRAVDGVSLDIERSRVTGVAGESGSGKSMTSLAICGLLPTGARASGSIQVSSVGDIMTMSERQLTKVRGRRIGMVFQDPTATFHPMLSIGTQLTDHVRFHFGVRKREALDRAADLLDQVQVPSPREALKKFPHQFSGGQLQRIAIASALAAEPELLIADEPTTALDVTVQAGVLRLIRDLCDEKGIAVLFITHDLGVMSAIADTVVIMRNGRVLEAGGRKQVLTAPKDPYTRDLIDALPPVSRPGGAP